MSVSKSVPSVIYFFYRLFSSYWNIHVQISILCGYSTQFTRKNLINSVKLKKLVFGVFCFFFFKFCFSELTSLTCSFQNVSYSRPISRNLMEGHCLLIKRSPGQYMYIIYLTFFLTKDESQSQTISIFDLYLC